MKRLQEALREAQHSDDTIWNEFITAYNSAVKQNVNKTLAYQSAFSTAALLAKDADVQRILKAHSFKVSESSVMERLAALTEAATIVSVYNKQDHKVTMDTLDAETDDFFTVGGRKFNKLAYYYETETE